MQVLLGKASGPAPVTYPWVGGTRKRNRMITGYGGRVGERRGFVRQGRGVWVPPMVGVSEAGARTFSNARCVATLRLNPRRCPRSVKKKGDDRIDPKVRPILLETPCCAVFRAFCRVSRTVNRPGDKGIRESGNFWLNSRTSGPKVRARTSMLETIHPAQVLTTRDRRSRTAVAILGDMPWEVGEPKWGNGLDVQLHPYVSMCFAIGSPNHVHQGRGLLRP